MGFFASRWIEKHGAETEKAAISTPAPVPQSKSKWYSRKREPDSPRGGTPSASGGKANAANLHLDTKLGVGGVNGNTSGYSATSPYATLTASSMKPSANGTQSPYGTMRKVSGPSTPSSSAKPRSATDSVTVTLAQKLEELATANSDGLLSDDEYRVLRQNIFERFGSVAAQIPVEQSPINMPSPSTRRNTTSANANGDTSGTSNSTGLPQGDSNFTVSNSRRSIRSNHSHGSSVQTAITSLIRRATRRSSNTPRTSFGGSAGNDGESTYSRGSRNSSIFPRGGTLPRTLVHKASAGSIGTTPSVMGGGAATTSYDVRSIASRRTNRSGLDNATIISRTTSRSRPPSSYHRRHAPSEGGWSDEIGTDWTAAELRAEIVSLEEESKRVMDMFNGLEMTTLMKHRPAMAGRTISEAAAAGSRTLPSDWTQDIKKSTPQEKSSRLSMSSSSMRSFAGLQRKGSLSFLRRNPQALPPLPPLPTAATNIPTSMSTSVTANDLASPSSSNSLRPMGLGSSQSNRSSPNLTIERGSGHGHGRLSRSRSGNVGSNHGRDGGSAAPMPAGAGRGSGDPEQDALEDIRLKRTSVLQRYDKRLEYLRARLRSAELHERLLK